MLVLILWTIGYENINQNPANNTHNYAATGSQPGHILGNGMRYINIL